MVAAMRIIAGEKKGLRLAQVKAKQIRPTADSTRELIFNVIGPQVNARLVLDVFAGTGSLGIEALSRGALRAIFVEISSQALQVIEANLRKTGFVERAEVIRLDASKALKLLSAAARKFDLILADPPYEQAYAQETLAAVDQLELLSPQGWLVIEHSARTRLSEAGKKLALVNKKSRGDSSVSFYRNA